MGQQCEGLQSIDSAAETLSISPWTVRAYAKTGRIKSVRIGRRVLVPSAEVRRLIEHGEPNTDLSSACVRRRGVRSF